NVDVRKNKDDKIKLSADITLVSNQENNVVINKGESGIKLSVVGGGLSKGNMVISEPSFGIDIGFSGQKSVGNISIGTRLQLGLGPSLDFGLPFGGSSSGESGDGNGKDDGGGGDKGDNKGDNKNDNKGDNKNDNDSMDKDEDKGGGSSTNNGDDNRNDDSNINTNGGENTNGSEDTNGSENTNGSEHEDNNVNGSDNMNGGKYGDNNTSGSEHGNNNMNGSEHRNNINTSGSEHEDGNMNGEHENNNMNGSEPGDDNMNDSKHKYNKIDGNEGSSTNYFILINENPYSFANSDESHSFSSNQDSALASPNDVYGNGNNLNTSQPPASDFIILTHENDQIAPDYYYSNNSFQNDGIYQSNSNYSDNSHSVTNDLNSLIVDDIIISSPDMCQGSAQDAQGDIFIDPCNSNAGFQAIEGNIIDSVDEINHSSTENKFDLSTTSGNSVGEINYYSTENKLHSSATSNNSIESSLFSTFDNAVRAENSPNITVFEQVLANTVQENLHLVSAIRTALSNATPSSDCNSKSPNNSVNDIDSFIKNITKHKKQDQKKDDSNSPGLSGSSESRRAEDGNKTQEKRDYELTASNKLSQEDKKNDDDDDEEENRPKEPCKNHPSSVRCFRCLSSAKGKK
ncbi:15804_t:CDS:1, partial [Racocetra fulgida]